MAGRLFFLASLSHLSAMLILCSLDQAVEAYKRYRPACVISLLSEEEEPPAFEGLAPANHLLLYVKEESCAASLSAAARKRAEEIVAFAKAWDGAGDILVHCKRGVARSSAAAFIIMCARAPEAAEETIIESLREQAPHADPCPLLVSYADDLLARDGRMLDAVEDLPPPCTNLSAPVSLYALGA